MKFYDTAPPKKKQQQCNVALPTLCMTCHKNKLLTGTVKLLLDANSTFKTFTYDELMVDRRPSSCCLLMPCKSLLAPNFEAFSATNGVQ